MVNLIFGIFGLLILADALFKIQMSMQRNSGWNLWWRFSWAILTGVLGDFSLLIRPFEAAEIDDDPGWCFGLFEGILNLCVAFTL